MSSPTSVDRSQPPENRDRDAENLLGQFLVASFQANKLSELLKEKMIGLPKKDIRLIVPGNPPLSVTVRIEPYREAQGDFLRKVKLTSEREFVTVVALVESPPLELSKAPGVGHEESTTRLEGAVQDAFVGLFRWWKNYGRQSPDYLKLDEWKTKVSILNSQDAVENTEEFLRSLDALEAKRKGHIIGSP